MGQILINMKVVVSAVAFSKNPELVNTLLSHFPDAVINREGKRYSKNELVDYYKEADAIITGLEKIDDDLLSNLPKLKLIAKYGVGLDNIDLDACNKRNIKIGWTGGVNKNSVAEMALGLMIMLSRNLYTTSNQLKNGVWNKSGGFSIENRTIGIVGLGHIGKELVRLLQPFNCKILVNDIINVDDYALKNGLKVVDMDELYKEADIISLHTPLNESTQNLINKESILKMKDSVIIINTSRGGIINERDLSWAFQNQKIAGAALDVFEIEPPEDQELLQFPNLINTPHIAGNSFEAVMAMGLAAIDHVVNFNNTRI